jgi:integrase
MTERRPGVWRLRVHTGRDARGRAFYRHETFRGGRREAATALARLVSEVSAAAPGATHDGKLTLEGFARAWIAGKVGRARPATLAAVEQNLRLRILPSLGHVALKKLSHLDLDALYGRLLTNGGRGGRGLAASTVLQCHVCVYMVLKAALKAGHIGKNPAAEATPPRPVQKAPPVLTIPDTATYLSAFRGSRLEAAAVVLLATGLRRGEMLGLTWKAVDFENGRVHVTQTVQEIRETRPGHEAKTRIVIVPPKTRASLRTIPIPSDAIAALRAHRQRQREECIRHGWSKPTFLFTAPESGEVWRPATFSRAFSDIAAKHGLKVWPHLLRHSHLTHLMAANVHPKIAQARAGHASVSTTLNLYSHASEQMQQMAVDVAQAVLQRAAPKPA